MAPGANHFFADSADPDSLIWTPLFTQQTGLTMKPWIVYILLSLSLSLVAGCNREQTPPNPSPPKPQASASSGGAAGLAGLAAPGSLLALGEQHYRRSCASCHDTGAGGAPLLGKADIWESRIDQGMETLVNHAIEGFKSSACVMPPRGGDTSMQIEAVALAVRYMVEKGLPPEAQADAADKPH